MLSVACMKNLSSFLKRVISLNFILLTVFAGEGSSSMGRSNCVSMYRRLCKLSNKLFNPTKKFTKNQNFADYQYRFSIVIQEMEASQFE